MELDIADGHVTITHDPMDCPTCGEMMRIVLKTIDKHIEINFVPPSVGMRIGWSGCSLVWKPLET